MCMYFIELEDVCDAETFDKTCHLDQVLVIQSAKYGRMSLGTCITTGYGHVGCYKDVTDLVSRRCAGKQSCSMFVTRSDQELIEDYSCDKDLVSYMEIDTNCQSGKLMSKLYLLTTTIAKAGLSHR